MNEVQSRNHLKFNKAVKRNKKSKKKITKGNQIIEVLEITDEEESKNKLLITERKSI